MIMFDVCSSFSRQKRIDTHSLFCENYFFNWVPFTGAEVAQKWPIHCRTSFNFFQIEFKTSLKLSLLLYVFCIKLALHIITLHSRQFYNLYRE